LAHPRRFDEEEGVSTLPRGGKFVSVNLRFQPGENGQNPSTETKRYQKPKTRQLLEVTWIFVRPNTACVQEQHAEASSQPRENFLSSFAYAALLLQASGQPWTKEHYP
jgi:hypothetical protein